MPGGVANQIRRLLGYHDCWRVRVAAHDRRHDRRVHDPQSLNSAHFQKGIDYRHLVIAHLACASRVPSGGRGAPNEGLDINVAPHIHSRRYLLATDIIERFGVQNSEVPTHT